MRYTKKMNTKKQTNRRRGQGRGGEMRDDMRCDAGAEERYRDLVFVMTESKNFKNTIELERRGERERDKWEREASAPRQ